MLKTDLPMRDKLGEHFQMSLSGLLVTAELSLKDTEDPELKKELQESGVRAHRKYESRTNQTRGRFFVSNISE